MNQLRQAFRRLRHDPSFSLLAVLTLALGIAANTAIFGVVHGILLRPLPYPDADRLVIVDHSAPGLSLQGIGQSEATFLRYREHNRTLAGMVLFRQRQAALTDKGAPERITTTQVSSGFFSVIGTPPALGRDFVPEDERPGATPVVVLTDALWQRRFGADPGVLGSTLLLDGVAHEVIGVAPSRLRYPEDAELWVVAPLDPATAELGAFGARALARLRDGVGLETAMADLNRLITDLEETFPESSAARVLAQAGLAAEARTLRDAVVGAVEPRLWMLLGMVGVVLLIACANVANLFVVRGEARQRDTAVRVALGASRRRLAGEALAESLILTAAGGLLGLAGAAGAIRLLVRFGPADLPRLAEVTLDGWVVGFDMAVALATGIVFGLLQLLLPRLHRLSEVLRDGARGATGGPARVGARRVLVAAQVALALVLLTAAGLMVRSFAHLADLDPGFRPAGVVTATVSLPATGYPDDEAAARFYTELSTRLRALPGVTAAGATSMLPLDGQFQGGGHRFADRPITEQEVPTVLGIAYVTAGYIEAMGIPLRAGRPLEDADAHHRTGAVLVSESLARLRWPGEDPLGKRLFPGRPAEDQPDPWYTVVGVVGDIRNVLTEEPPEIVYYPVLAKADDLWTVRDATVVLRTTGDPLALADALRRTVGDLDRSVPVAHVRTLEDRIRAARAETAFTVVLLLIAAAVSLTLGTVGTFGIVSYLVARRRSEIGVRMALGARTTDVAGLVLREGLLVAGAGGAIGILAAAGVARFMESILFEVSPLDPVTFASVPLVLLAAVLAATWLPARRATRIDPALALRGS
jgi:predicted permease